jgi:predicted DNA-binding helix-hairpin-helix protein
MNLEQKLDTLMSLAADDREGSPGSTATPTVLPPRLRNAGRAGALGPLNIRNVRIGANGPRAKLLRILMTNACSYNCHYCPMRRDRNLPRTLLRPEEVVRIFMDAVQRGWASGLFLTTGIPGRPQKVMDDLIQVLELLRVRHRYAGYVHVKLIPGADDAQVARMTQLATRVSLNLETPCGASLPSIAPDKSFDSALVTLSRARTRVTEAQDLERDGRPRDALKPGGIAGMTTQFVIGATDDSDRTTIGKAVELYRGGGVHHAHFSAFRPIRETPLESRRATPAAREHRLYQADNLIRRYRFAPGELVFDEGGNLPLSYDPKVAWALANRDTYPIEVTRASYSQLLRVPGVGPLGAKRIVDARRTTSLQSLANLRALGVLTTRAAGFLLLNGRRLAAERWREQLNMFDAAADVGAFAGAYEFSPGTFR